PLHEHPLHPHPLDLSTEEKPTDPDLSSRAESLQSDDAVEGIAVSEDVEPESASASYRIDPAAPSAYRQSGIVEPEIESVPEETSPSIDAEVHEYEAHHELEEERIPSPQIEPFFEESVSIVEQDNHESSSLAGEVSPGSAYATPHEITFEAQPGETPEETEEDSVTQQDAHIFNPGDGNLEEEMIDEEETEGYTAQALVDDEEYDDLVEETLDVQMDSGLLSELVRDQHIDQRTRFTEDPDEDSTLEDDSFGEEASFEEGSADLELEEVPDGYGDSEEDEDNE